jgi:hypothetical protein
MRCDAKKSFRGVADAWVVNCCGTITNPGGQILLKMSVQMPPAGRIKRISQELLKPFRLAAILGERRKLLWMLPAAAVVGSSACRKEAEVHAPEVRPVRMIERPAVIKTGGDRVSFFA